MIVLYHAAVISLYTFSIWYDQQYVNIAFPKEEYKHVPFKGRAIFFTFWTFVIQTLYFTVALLNDVMGTNAATKRPPFIRKLKDTLFSLTLSTALYVVLVFWLFYSFDKTMIFPNEEAEKQIPVWLNHILHTTILPVILIELYFTKRNYPSKKMGISVSFWLTVMYSTYIHVMYFKYGIWPYPFLYMVNWGTKIIYFIGSGIIGYAFYLLGEQLDSLLSKNTSVSHANGIKKIH